MKWSVVALFWIAEAVATFVIMSGAPTWRRITALFVTVFGGGWLLTRILLAL